MRNFSSNFCDFYTVSNTNFLQFKNLFKRVAVINIVEARHSSYIGSYRRLCRHNTSSKGWGCGGLFPSFLFRGQNSVYGVVLLYLSSIAHLPLLCRSTTWIEKSPCVLLPFHRKWQPRQIIAVLRHSVRGVMLTIWQSLCHGTLCTFCYYTSWLLWLHQSR